MTRISFELLPHGRLQTVTGPVGARKSAKLISAHKRAHHGGYDNILVVKHPEEDANHPGKIVSKVKDYFAPAYECKTAHDISNLVTEDTRFVMIAGVHHYDRNIVFLLRELINTGRDAIASGLNLTYEGEPYGYIGEVLALATKNHTPDITCEEQGCQIRANRSWLVHGMPQARCHNHYHKPGRPDHKYWLRDQIGCLELFVGGMYADKSENLRQLALESENKASFGSVKNTRDEGLVSRDAPDSVLPYDEKVEKGWEIVEVLQDRSDVKQVFINESNFIEDIREAAVHLVYQGFHVVMDGLNRSFQKMPFGDIPGLLASADRIHNCEAYCRCGRMATESQRLVCEDGVYYPVPFNDVIEEIQGSKQKKKYEARCLVCHELPDEPNDFQFPPLEDRFSKALEKSNYNNIDSKAEHQYS